MAPKTKQKRNYAYWAEVYNQNNVIANTETNAGGFSAWAPAENPAAPKTETKPQTPITGTYSAWAPETVSGVGSVTKMRSAGEKTETAPIATVGETGSGAGEYSVWADSSNDTDTTPTAEESGFAKWLEGNEEYQSAVAKAISEYDRNRATYGAQGEALARSGLVGSGYSAWADSQAYAQMQRAKENARNISYAAWLGEKENEELKAEQDALALKNEQYNLSELLNENGKDEITDADINYYKSMGYSDEAIKAVQSNLATYKEQKAAEQNQAFTDSLAAFNSSGDAAAFLEANGVKVEGMTDDQIGQNLNALIDAKLADGTIDAATASAYYRDTIILDEDLSGKSVAGVAKAAREAAQVKPTVREKLTDADYKAILQASYDALGVTDVIFKNSDKANADVTIKVNVNGVQRTYTCDWGGEFRVGNEKNAILNQKYGNAKLALHNGKMYYQYKDNKWTEIKVKGGSEGDIAEGNDVLAVVAAYYGANQINRSVRSEEGKQEIRDEI